jgi:hypothetical protein
MRTIRAASALITRLTLASLFLVPAWKPLDAQQDFFNTAEARPGIVEDAYAIDRNSLQLYLAPIGVTSFEDARPGWFARPGVAVGLLPRTEIGIDVPVVLQPDNGPREFGLGGVNVTALHTFNVETNRRPALALRASFLVPAGRFAPRSGYGSLGGIATRGFAGARLHFNGQYAFGDAIVADSVRSVSGPGRTQLSRWLAGVAIDRTFPLRALLVSAEVYAGEPLARDAVNVWSAGAALRKQLTPTLSLDVSLARQLTAPGRAWSVSTGLVQNMSVSNVLPGFGRWGN